MGDHEPDEEQFEADCRDHEKVHRRDHVAMISQERGPSLALVIATTSFREVTRHSCEADSESQLLELGLDPSRTPRVLAGEAMNELANLTRNGRPPGPLIRDRPPVAPKALTVPADHGFGLNDDETGLPSGPESKKGNPEVAVKRGKPRARLLVDVGRELLSKRQLDNRLLTLAAEQGRDCGDEHRRIAEEVLDHVATLSVPGRIVQTESLELFSVE